jgi:flavin reductase (DIM6/NTAB) family NADH-FMN oxidoreductase RutF
MENTLIANMKQMTYGIYVLTTRNESEINGMIASWVSQVSYDPPLMMVAVHPNRYSHTLITQSRIFALHSLDRAQKDLLARFKDENERQVDALFFACQVELQRLSKTGLVIVSAKPRPPLERRA